MDPHLPARGAAHLRRARNIAAHVAAVSCCAGATFAALAAAFGFTSGVLTPGISGTPVSPQMFGAHLGLEGARCAMLVCAAATIATALLSVAHLLAARPSATR